MTADAIDLTERWTTIRPMALVVKMVTREPSVAEAAQTYGRTVAERNCDGTM